MKVKIQTLVNLLLKLHKALLDSERARYEKNHGPILDNNAYFNLVLSHEDFKWLRILLEAIALLDEESEAENISTDKIEVLADKLQNILSSNDNSEFSQRYQAAVSNNSEVSSLDKQVKDIINTLS